MDNHRVWLFNLWGFQYSIRYSVSSEGGNFIFYENEKEWEFISFIQIKP
jgi:hypothetical protein